MAGPLRFAALGCALGLTGCGQPPTPFPDYCYAQGRTIPRDERIVAALVYVSTKPFDRRLPQFTEFRTAMQSRLEEIDDRRVAQAYLARYPDCCEVVEPFVVTEYPLFGSDPEAHYFMSDHRDFHWSKDVLIAAIPPSAPPRREVIDTPFAGGRLPVRVQSSSCGDVDQLHSG